MLLDVIEEAGMLYAVKGSTGERFQLISMMPTPDFEVTVQNSPSRSELKRVIKLKREGFTTEDIIELKEGGLLDG